MPHNMPPINGNAIIGGEAFRSFANIGFGSEILYSFIIIVCSLMVYFGTKELYELSSYKGIKYFRQAFLFFALAYFFRSIIKYIMLILNIQEILDFSPGFFGALSIFLFMYFNTMSIFYILQSVLWKKWGDNKYRAYLFHLLAIMLGLIILLSRDFQIRLISNLILFIIILVTLYIVYKDGKNKKNNLYAIYMLLFAFLLLNIFDIIIPKFLKELNLFLYLASSGIFLVILYKVLKKSGN